MQHVHAIPPYREDALMHSRFEVSVVHADQTRAQVKATGSLDRSTVHQLTAVLETLLGWGRRHVRLDMSRVTVSDEGSLPALIQVHEMFLAEHGILVITVPRPGLAALLRQRRLERALFICEEPQDRVPEEHGGEGFDGLASSVAGSGSRRPPGQPATCQPGGIPTGPRR
jgi:anti-anti-sigma regulatory factor